MGHHTRIIHSRRGMYAVRHGARLGEGDVVSVFRTDHRDGGKSININGGKAHLALRLGDFLTALGVSAEDCRRALGE